ncbi:hypothetical protein PC114_g9833 [Phytophthora cactorum]|uniref:Uncharacterized protein n=1 Tax=Phytophthora cactorum TaxID=29920 RepID=A0A8T1E0U2_9STRA|nr:hypothetical protein PC114_g9833 [Phytophthora cactorum]KAG2946892.1 hypothetical protein PC117_g7256 [Phytophthora cactorum]KAG3023599.1 hypothetical protein PC120_g7485 [Phytophthora cactorum]KAG4057232.1 hypothetical protein PC123_g7734 [Phytophthora cactorum]
MSLESSAVLSHLSSWLTCFELCCMRALNRSFYTGIPRHTWELTASNISSSKSMDQLSKVFPHVWCLRVQDAILEETPTMKSLMPWLNRSEELRKLVLTRVQEPAIIAPNLEALVIEHCPVTRFHADTKLPQLKKLSLSSRSFTALHAQCLIKDMLPKSPMLEDLSLASCSHLEQVLVNPGDLPALRRLDLSGCPKLDRVHVTSKLLETLDLSRNDSLQYVLLDLERVVDLDLSFLKNLTHLYIRSPSLRRLNLRGCDQLMRNATSVTCPNLQFVVLQGTTLKVDDFNRDEVNDEVFALPDSNNH